MISFEMTEEQKLAQSMVRELAGSSLRPAARDADERCAMPDSILNELWSTGVIQAEAALDADPASRSPVLNAILLEELAAGDATFAIGAGASMGFVSALARYGSAAQRERILPQFTERTCRVASIAIMEPDFAFDATVLRTSAARTSRGYRLSGIKGPVPLATRSSHFLVIAQCDGTPAAFIVERDSRGVSVGETRPGLGLRALESATVSFNDVELDASARLGESVGCNVQSIIDSSRVALAAIMSGAARAVMEFVIPYLKDRVVHGAPLAQKQVIAFRLADMRIETDAMRWMTWKAASILEKGGDATREAQLAYTYAGEQALWIADEGVQMLGGHGYLRDNPVEKWYRDVRTLSVLEGVAGI